MTILLALTGTIPRKTGGKQFEEQATIYKKAIAEDKEMLNIIIQAFIAGIFDDDE